MYQRRRPVATWKFLCLGHTLIRKRHRKREREAGRMRTNAHGGFSCNAKHRHTKASPASSCRRKTGASTRRESLLSHPRAKAVAATSAIAAAIVGAASTSLAIAFPAIRTDPIAAFNVYGTTTTSLFIERFEPGSQTRVVSRSRGVTARCCANAVPTSYETPQFVQLPLGMRAGAYGNQSCTTGTGADRRSACEPACARACSDAIAVRGVAEREASGLDMGSAFQERAVKKCTRQCLSECTKPGRGSAFVSTT